MSLRLDWCSHAAAKWACEHWHYSRSMSTGPYVRVGVWEDERYIGCVLFSRGATPHLGKPYGLAMTEVAELTRVALTNHKARVSRIVAIALRMLKQNSPKLRLCVSFADPHHNHIGVIYQAGGWIYTGTSAAAEFFQDTSGRVWHPRQVSATGLKTYYGKLHRVARHDDCEKVARPGKHRYLMPLDPAMRAQLQPLAKPYPRRQPLESEGPSDQGGHEGAAMRPVGSTEAA
jgi:hypothetical protein